MNQNIQKESIKLTGKMKVIELKTWVMSRCSECDEITEVTPNEKGKLVCSLCSEADHE